jgi:hypothetical protein
MADPRADVGSVDVDLEFATFKIDNSTITYSKTADYGSASAGVNLMVSISANDTVQLVSDAEALAGRLEEVYSDNFARVAVRAKRMKMKGGDAATLTLGSKMVGALGAASAKGYVRSVAATTGSYVQGTATETQRGRGTIINNDATNPVARFP